VDQKQLDRAFQIIAEYKPAFEKETAQLTLQMRTQLHFAITRAWFVAGDYSNALKQINGILNLPTSSARQHLYVLCRLMNLQINASLIKTDYLIYAIRSIERKLRAEQKIYGVEKMMISFLKKLLNRKPIKNIQEQLKVLSENPYERQLMKELNLADWMASIGSKKF